ncbi:hypothetical protein COX24_00170 [bacterium (Candidatus Gribaldobacteria) CG23_combo_of_CG06-09_8_20_14_all_37_87_8]|uniref:Uncharacterized protein n=2 Tax=Candidatus Gribaldobacteria TaxID=2798536 RepID=A0A2G9ZG05_9BACT|nr:MAG: hypothetical protein COX24_00170 [bacterium (Candidatus Gribaldobacteria) CG23_combo_of_CG06-09_8_20_14_all_37_87_8]PIR90286.1 MAG: hypothetical protein COU05_02630 [bacterium (Candidatus Gribaldobacteria) CG10_big_fil_rev_8_21_14_0_10_37_21]
MQKEVIRRYMRKTLEYHFNPEISQKNGTFFETCCFSPTTCKEKQAGLLYLIAESEGRSDLIKELFQIIEQEFYQNGFQTALDKTNEFINQNNLTSLHLAILALSYPYKIRVSKIGKIKILLLRNEVVFDVISELDNQGLFKFIEGNLQKNDKLIFLTNSIFNVFLKYKVLAKIAQRNEKELKTFFKENKTFFQTICGTLIIAFIKKAPWPLFLKKPKGPLPPPSKLEKGVIAAILLVILLLLGYLLF